MTNHLPIIPTVQRINYLNDTFSMNDQAKLFCQGKINADDEFALSTVVDDLDTCFQYNGSFIHLDKLKEWKFGAIGFQQQLIEERIENPPELYEKDEGYALAIEPDGIMWWAETEQGFFNACQTVRQLIRINRVKGKLPTAIIIDYPDMPMRGIHEDYGRNQLPTLRDHKRSIERMALFKINTYMFYMEPDHIVYDFDPTIGCDYDRFTKDELREIVDYAKQYHIEVIPLIQSMGHMENLLKHPDYMHLAEMPHAPDISPINPESITLMENILTEVLPIFDSNWIHLGLDETFTVGNGQSKQVVSEQGKEKVFATWYLKLKEIVERFDKKMMMYHDMIVSHPKIIDLLPKDITIMFWDYVPRTDYEGLQLLKQSGFRLVGLSGSWDWYNLYPDTSLAVQNINQLVPQLVDKKGFAHFISSWGDPFGENLSELNWYNFAYGAAKSWSASQKIPMETFTEAFMIQMFISDSNHLFEALHELVHLYRYKEKDSFFSNKSGQQNHSEVWRQYHADVLDTVLELTSYTEEDIGKLQYLKNNCNTVLDHLHMENHLTLLDNDDLLESIRLTVERVGFVADKYRILKRVTSNSISIEEKQQMIRWLSGQFSVLKERYMEAWQKTNRPIQLIRLRGLFEKQQIQYNTLEKLVRDGSF